MEAYRPQVWPAAAQDTDTYMKKAGIVPNIRWTPYGSAPDAQPYRHNGTLTQVGSWYQNVCAVPIVGKLETVPKCRGWVNHPSLLTEPPMVTYFVILLTAPSDSYPFDMMIIWWWYDIVFWGSPYIELGLFAAVRAVRVYASQTFGPDRATEVPTNHNYGSRLTFIVLFPPLFLVSDLYR